MTTRIGYHLPLSGSRHLHLFQLERVAGKDCRWTILGYHRFGRAELEEAEAKGYRVRLKALGVISFTPDVSPALFEDVFESFKVRGWVRNRPQRQSVRTV